MQSKSNFLGYMQNTIESEPITVTLWGEEKGSWKETDEAKYRPILEEHPGEKPFLQKTCECSEALSCSGAINPTTQLEVQS